MMLFIQTFAFILLISTSSWAKTVVFIGDSLTEGYSLAKSAAYPSLIEARLKSHLPEAKVINGGVSGATSQSAPSQMRWYLRTKPDLVVLALGANDGLRGLPVTQMKKNLSNAIKLAQEQKVPVILAGMQMPPNYGPGFRKEFAQAFPELAKSYKIDLIPFLLKDVAAIDSLNLPDKIHPNEAGHKIMAETVWPYVKKALKIN